MQGGHITSLCMHRCVCFGSGFSTSVVCKGWLNPPNLGSACIVEERKKAKGKEGIRCAPLYDCTPHYRGQCIAGSGPLNRASQMHGNTWLRKEAEHGTYIGTYVCDCGWRVFSLQRTVLSTKWWWWRCDTDGLGRMDPVAFRRREQKGEAWEPQRKISASHTTTPRI